MNIAGINQICTLVVKAVVNSDGSITCTGTKAIKMSDFKIQLPASEKKRMEIGDELILTFKILLSAAHKILSLEDSDPRNH